MLWCTGEGNQSLCPVLWCTGEGNLSLRPVVWCRGEGNLSLRPVLWCTGEGNLSLRPVLWCRGEGNLSLRPVLWCTGEGNLSLRPVQWCTRDGNQSLRPVFGAQGSGLGYGGCSARTATRHGLQLLPCVRCSLSAAGAPPWPLGGTGARVGCNAAATPELQQYARCTGGGTCAAARVQLLQHSRSPTIGNGAGVGCRGATPTVPSTVC